MCTKIWNNRASKPVPKVKENEHRVMFKTAVKGNDTVFINTILNFTNCNKEEASVSLHGIYWKGHWLFIQEISSLEVCYKAEEKNHKTKQLQSKMDRLQTPIPQPSLQTLTTIPGRSEEQVKRADKSKKNTPELGNLKTQLWSLQGDTASLTFRYGRTMASLLTRCTILGPLSPTLSRYMN